MSISSKVFALITSIAVLAMFISCENADKKSVNVKASEEDNKAVAAFVVTQEIFEDLPMTEYAAIEYGEAKNSAVQDNSAVNVDKDNFGGQIATNISGKGYVFIYVAHNLIMAKISKKGISKIWDEYLGKKAEAIRIAMPSLTRETKSYLEYISIDGEYSVRLKHKNGIVNEIELVKNIM